MAIKSIIRKASDVFVGVAGRITHVQIEDIIYVEHNSRTVLMYTMKGIIYIPYISLERIHAALGTDYLFQCHKSYLVNRIYIEKIDRTENSILLKNLLGKIPVGRKYKTEVLRKMHYIN